MVGRPPVTSCLWLIYFKDKGKEERKKEHATSCSKGVYVEDVDEDDKNDKKNCFILL